LSSILDALKKLEKETSPQDYPLAPARTGRKVFTPKNTMGIIGVVCVCIGAIGFAAYYQRSPEKTPGPLLGDVTPVVTSKAQETPKPEATLDEQKTPLPFMSRDRISTATARKPEAIFAGSKTTTKPGSSEGGNHTGEIKAEKRRVVELKKAQEESPVVGKAFQEPASQLLIKEKDKPDSIDDLSKKALTRKKKPLPMDRLEGVGFKIQAIPWGETPQARLVVISNQVLREGDSLEGYQISHINPDDVVLRRGDKVYQLDFGLKGQP
jgi:hypothetical protein